MIQTKLIDTLKDLKATRRLSSESEAMMKPFVGFKTEFSFSFIESSSTFASRLGDEFKDGMTVIAQFENTELECSILLPPQKILGSQTSPKTKNLPLLLLSLNWIIFTSGSSSGNPSKRSLSQFRTRACRNIVSR